MVQKGKWSQSSDLMSVRLKSALVAKFNTQTRQI